MSGVIGTAVIGHRMQCGRANPRLEGDSAMQHAMNQTEQLARQQQRQQGREHKLPPLRHMARTRALPVPCGSHQRRQHQRRAHKHHLTFTASVMR